jgi:glycosyltransferase involved in cell wall biosynthesis
MNEKTKENGNIQGLKFLLITHTFTTGPTQELRDYFINNKVTFSFIENPFSFNKNQNRPQITYFKAGEKRKQFSGFASKGPNVLYFIKDFFYTIYFVVKTGEKYDVCIAADNLNTFSAWFLKKIGYIGKLIYWTIDYTPRRFENNILNKIYHWMDRFCCYHSDLIWNSSKRMMDARKNNGVDIKKCANEVIVVDGCHFDDITRIPDDKVNKFKLVFMGHLIKGKGVDFILNAIPELAKKYPDVSLTIVGTGTEEETLKNLAKDLNIEKNVSFTGFVKEHTDLEKIVASCGIALAPYVPDPNSFTFFSDVGKVKIYIASGLPVLITDVPEIARDIQDKKAGLIFDYNRESFIEKIGILLDSDAEYYKYRHNAIEFARSLDWKNVFGSVINETLDKFSTPKI